MPLTDLGTNLYNNAESGGLYANGAIRTILRTIRLVKTWLLASSLSIVRKSELNRKVRSSGIGLSTAIHDADALALGFVDLLGIGRDLLGGLERDDGHVEHAGAPRRAGDVERRGHRPARVVVRGRGRAQLAPGAAAPADAARERGAGRVERDVAAADDDDALAEVDAEALVDVQEVLDRAQHAVEVVAREIEVAGPARCRPRGTARRAGRGAR